MASIAEKCSVLDAVFTDARRLQRGLTKTDKDKLEESGYGERTNNHVNGPNHEETHLSYGSRGCLAATTHGEPRTG
ncbi:MAG: hypothetical protein D6753_12350 [Planctomycetota bacterium]|nr:MAG: hypothetical protein D6753_12350 [Planctomycetota bacterium]